MVSAKDQDTQKWLGQVVAGGTPTSTTPVPGSPSLHQDNATPLALPAKSPIRARPPVSSSPAAKMAAGLTESPSYGSIGASGDLAAKRASQLAAGAAAEALYNPRSSEPLFEQSQLSNAGAAASLAAHRPSQRASDTSETASRPASTRDGDLRGHAGRAALLAARESKPYEVVEHTISQNAGRAALLAAHDTKPYEIPDHQLSQDAGRAALLANENVTPYEVPEHKLSAYAGKAALQAHQDPVSIEVPKHELVQSASTAALSAFQDPITVEIEKHELSANAGKAALLAHHDYQPIEVPVHELSANAGKAALLAHQSPDVQPQPVRNLTSEASARNALKAATLAHHDPAMRPTKPDDLSAKGAASALKAATQAHHERADPFKYVHPSDDAYIGRLARENTRKTLAAMEPREPGANTLAYANLSYANAQKRQALADAEVSSYRSTDSVSGYQGASDASLAARRTPVASRSRAGTATSQGTAGPVDLLAVARKNVDSQMAARGITTAKQDSDRESLQRSTSRPQMAHRASSLAFKDGQERAVESARHREQTPDEREIAARIAREMAQFDQQRKRNQNNPQFQSALMEAARRNARATLNQMERNRPYAPPSLQDIAKLEDALNEDKVKARKASSSGRQVDIGGGHYMSQAEIEAVAAKRVQPVFDEMDEHVAAINQRKAEIKAREEAEKERKAAEKAERHKQKELEKERARNTKIAEKEAKEQAKKEAAERKAAEEQRKREERAEEERKRQEKLAEERKEREMAAQKKKEEDAVAELEKQEAAKLARTDSANAVATAAATPSIKGVSLPGTNAPLPGQNLESADKSTVPAGSKTATAVAPVEPISEVLPVSGTVKPSEAVLDRSNAVERTNTLDSRTGEPLATYVVDNKGMTDTEGETDDEWTDAVEETPGVERREPSYQQHLGHARAPSDGDDTASVKTAKPSRPDALAAVPEGMSVDKSVLANVPVEAAPPIVKTEADLAAAIVHEGKTKFKEEFA